MQDFALVTADGPAAEHLKASRFDQLVPQLQTLSFEIKLWKRLDSKLRSSLKTRTLIDCHTGGLLDTVLDEKEVVHARMYSTADLNSRLETGLDRFATSLEQNPRLPLQSLYLDSSLRPSDSISPKLLEVVTKIVRITQDRQIDLVFETAPNDFRIDPCISAEFRRRQRVRVEKETQ